MKIFYAILFLVFTQLDLPAQEKLMTQDVYKQWNSIQNVQLSNDGNWISYVLATEEADDTLALYNCKDKQTRYFPRAGSAGFDKNSEFIAFRIKPAYDSIRQLKRQGSKTSELPGDTLGIYNLERGIYDNFADIESFQMAEDCGSYVAIKFKPEKEKDSTRVKEESGTHGSRLWIYNASKDSMHRFDYVLNYEWAKKACRILIHHTGMDSSIQHKIEIHDLNTQSSYNMTGIPFTPFKFTSNEEMTDINFLMAEDSIKKDDSHFRMYRWSQSDHTLRVLADSSSTFLEKDERISPDFNNFYSDNSERIYFGVQPIPAQEDTSLLDDEKVKVEIWHYQDQDLYTEQENSVNRDKKKAFLHVYEPAGKTFKAITNSEIPNYQLQSEYESDKILCYSDQEYRIYNSWLGYSFRDVYLYDLESGSHHQILDSIQGYTQMSPNEKYVYWYSRPDTSWMLWDIEKSEKRVLTRAGFYDELNDRPMPPWPSGLMSWTKNDSLMLIYDHYDIWQINPENGTKKRLTQGRENDIRYRYISLDREIDELPSDTTILLHIFDNEDKSSGYAYLHLKHGSLETIVKDDYQYNTRVYKAENADRLVFTRESYEEFPDLRITNSRFEDIQKISNANPQQSDYAWGSIELFKWMDYDKKERHALLVKPPGFDPSKKYPLIINFYEKSSDRLHQHREPYPHRSSINYSYWSNKGYLIFNPDIYYKVGYPGQSCYDAIMSSLDALLESGFVDETRIGLQGHSWGGYQIADLITRTNRFACAEAGAPVVNMTSAYGGIRWGSGRSRMFQYEQTQSRIGASLWENRELYMENSPLFRLPAVNTPVLILHNDEDGAVPWYQGIEYFVALRRLGKQAWFLNYNNEPHWPVKYPNRLDFNKRLEQFFDHFLMDQPMPEWMKSGVPAVEKETNSGFAIPD